MIKFIDSPRQVFFTPFLNCLLSLSSSIKLSFSPAQSPSYCCCCCCYPLPPLLRSLAYFWCAPLFLSIDWIISRCCPPCLGHKNERYSMPIYACIVKRSQARVWRKLLLVPLPCCLKVRSIYKNVCQSIDRCTPPHSTNGRGSIVQNVRNSSVARKRKLCFLHITKQALVCSKLCV